MEDHRNAMQLHMPAAGFETPFADGVGIGGILVKLPGWGGCLLPWQK